MSNLNCMPRGEINWRKREAGIKRNRDALNGKTALYSTYESMGLAHTEAARGVLQQIYRLRIYLRNRTGDDE
jgi:hypothetical protein